jgi:hypothetical protein
MTTQKIDRGEMGREAMIIGRDSQYVVLNIRDEEVVFKEGQGKRVKFEESQQRVDGNHRDMDKDVGITSVEE